MENNKNILEVKKLNKVFPQKGSLLLAVDGAGFSLKKGETIGLIGESGSGKTTIGRTIIRLHKPTSGRILIDGVDVASKKLTKDEIYTLRSNVQMIFQDPYSSLNEQKNIMNIVSEPIKTLKLDQKYITDLYKDSDKIYHFFGYQLEDYYSNRIFRFRKFANKIANEAYDDIFKSINEIQFNKKTKIENSKLLLSTFFGWKEKANHQIVNRMLSIPNEIFGMWENYRKRVQEGDLELSLEKNLLESMNAYEDALERSKHSKKCIQLNKELKKLEQEEEALETFTKNLNKQSSKSFENAISEWKNNAKIKLISAKKTETFGEFNFIFLDYLISRKINKIIKKIQEEKNLINDAFPEMVHELYEAFKLELKDKFNEYKNVNDKSIKTEIKNINQLSVKITKISDDFIEKASIKNAELDKYIYKKFLEDASILKIETLQILKDKIIAKKAELEEESKVEKNLISPKEVELLKQKYEEAARIDREDLEKYKKERVIRVAKEEAERKKILEDQNKFLLENNKKSEILLQDKFKEILALNIDNFESFSSLKSDSNLKKWFEKEIKKYNSNINSIDQEIKRNQKDLDIIQKFIFNTLSSKRKIKKLLVKNRVFKALEDSGLTKAHAFRYPHEFSGGMRQRVGIARAIIAEPKIIIADEPIAALDLSIQAQIVNMLKKLQKRDNMSMIFIAHDLSMVKYISDKILIIHLGKIVEFGKTEEIFENPIHPYTKNLISSMPDIAKISNGFEENNFKATYLDKYSSLNSPEYHKISSTHEVLADQEQIKTWTK
ncbi:ATP-binding cassette domain-containing protein [Mycoplasma marinum]|uniref:ABC transporter domain-containing protein n=1 Tax=Mycoplasma marinum TaxID=1937190 RepID=A0A4R0XUP9_9MOLU|nr:ATP-binding cassette domain-containing protein [Mycoplasma marinum]TCG11419.1 hypothetical protein C4B24_01975 [Mycoplasma marinum]